MPLKSKKQWRWMFKNEPAMARRWARHTPGGYRGLPASKPRGQGAAMSARSELHGWLTPTGAFVSGAGHYEHIEALREMTGRGYEFSARDALVQGYSRIVHHGDELIVECIPEKAAMVEAFVRRNVKTPGAQLKFEFVDKQRPWRITGTKTVTLSCASLALPAAHVIARMFDAGKTIQEICRATGATWAAVRRMLLETGRKVRSPMRGAEMSQSNLSGWLDPTGRWAGLSEREFHEDVIRRLRRKVTGDVMHDALVAGYVRLRKIGGELYADASADKVDMVRRWAERNGPPSVERLYVTIPGSGQQEFPLSMTTLAQTAEEKARETEALLRGHEKARDKARAKGDYAKAAQHQASIDALRGKPAPDRTQQERAQPFRNGGDAFQWILFAMTAATVAQYLAPVIAEVGGKLVKVAKNKWKAYVRRRDAAKVKRAAQRAQAASLDVKEPPRVEPQPFKYEDPLVVEFPTLKQLAGFYENFKKFFPDARARISKVSPTRLKLSGFPMKFLNKLQVVAQRNGGVILTAPPHMSLSLTSGPSLVFTFPKVRESVVHPNEGLHFKDAIDDLRRDRPLPAGLKYPLIVSGHYLYMKGGAGRVEVWFTKEYGDRAKIMALAKRFGGTLGAPETYRANSMSLSRYVLAMALSDRPRAYSLDVEEYLPDIRNKRDLVRIIAEELNVTQVSVKPVVQRTLDQIANTLIAQGRIELRGFGVFELKRRPARFKRDPNTQRDIFKPDSVGVIFKPAKIIKQRLR